MNLDIDWIGNDHGRVQIRPERREFNVRRAVR
jgi:hypothetical protein